MRNRLDVMQLLIEQGADLEIEGDDGRFYMYGTPLSVATYYYNTAAVKLLLEHGADVNHRPRLEGGRTVLFVAIVSKQLHLVELLLSHGADANVFADYQDKRERYHNKVCGYSPLHAALRSFSSIRRVRRNSRIDPLGKPATAFAAHLAILKLVVPRCDSFDLIIDDAVNSTYRLEPCVVHFFQTELKLGWDDDFTTTKYLLRNGAVAKFSQFYDCLFEITTSFKPITTSFLQLLLLSGCKFDNITEMKTKERTCNQLWFDEHIQPVLDNVDELLSQPLSLQELSVMAIRQSIGSRQLWAKIYSLSVPPSFKDMIQLKTYNPDKNTRHYMFFNAYDPRPWDRLPVCLLGEHTL